MSHRARAPTVPLEAGAGPANPPCPACGEPLFGWIDARPGMTGPVSRCESCGLAVAGGPAEPDEALRALEATGAAQRFAVANRSSFAAWIGGAGWAGLEPGQRFLFTAEAARRLLARRDRIVTEVRWRPGRSIALMWQTVLNGFTFGHNVALAAFGRARAVPAPRPWQRRLDAAISVAVAIPALLFALPLELIAAALRRGGAIEVSGELL